MGFDGNGNWSSPFYPVTDRDNGVAILASKFQTLIQSNLKESFENCILRDGTGRPTSNINWNGQKITNLAIGTAAVEPSVKISEVLNAASNKIKENKGFATNPFAEDLLTKYTVTPNVYDNVVDVHTKAGKIEKAPAKWMGKTIEEAKKALGFNGKKYTLIKTPIEDMNINEGHLRHLLFENPSNRREKLFYAVGALKNPNLITKTTERGHTYHNYIKLYKEYDSPVSHMQIVKVKDDGNFYVTNFEPTKKQIEQKIKEGQIVYDLSNVSSSTSKKPSIEDIPTMRSTSTTDTNSITQKGQNVKGKSISQILKNKEAK